MRKKKGISPLIATVLILGFTVALAAVIMVWGNRFTTTIQKNTEETATTTLSCATDVDLKIVRVCNSTPTDYTVSVANDQSGKISRVILRFYNGSGSDIMTNDTAFANLGGIPGYGTKTESVVGFPLILANYVEAIPVAIINGKEVTCTANKQDTGEIGGAPLDSCV